MTKRIEWIDAARGIGIILVVAGHANRGLMGAKISSGMVWHIADIWLYTFHMPLFMILAGLNIPDSLRKGASLFLRAKIWTVAYPYILWSVIQCGLMIAFSGMTNAKAEWVSIFQIGWRPISPFWFLYALFVFMLLVAFIKNSFTLFVIAISSLIMSQFISGDSIVHQLSYQFIFFVFGVKFSNEIKRLKISSLFLPIILVLWVTCASFVPVTGETPYLTPIAFPASISGILLIFAIAQFIRGRMAFLLIFIGQASMAIFVMHILATAGTRIILIKANIAFTPPVMLIVCTAAGVFGPLLAYLMLRRFGFLALFGLARPMRQANCSA